MMRDGDLSVTRNPYLRAEVEFNGGWCQIHISILRECVSKNPTNFLCCLRSLGLVDLPVNFLTKFV